MKKTSRSKTHAKLFIVAFAALLLQSSALVTYHSLRGQALEPAMRTMSAPAALPVALPVAVPTVQRLPMRPLQQMQQRPAAAPPLMPKMQRPAAGTMPSQTPAVRPVRDPCPLIAVMKEHFDQMAAMCQTQAAQQVQQ